MSIRLEMLQVARLAPKVLGESSGLVRAFFRRQQAKDGGFLGRSDHSDLYYTVFGLEGLIALDTPLSGTASPETTAELRQVFSRAEAFLAGFKEGDGLDFVHLCCLARGWASIRHIYGARQPLPLLPTRLGIIERIEGFRAKDGGFNSIPGSQFGTAYGAFLAVGAWQDLGLDLPDPGGVLRSIERLETGDGAWTNERAATAPPQGLSTRPAEGGATNATAAAVTLLRNLRHEPRLAAGSWLLAQAHPQGGFLAVPKSPIPDLLSTATALHALAGLQVSLDEVREPCLDFIDSLWTNEGGFCGHWHDEYLDCEYTYYGLLALGHLA